MVGGYGSTKGEPYARDLCRKHYRRLRRRGLLEVRLTEGSK